MQIFCKIIVICDVGPRFAWSFVLVGELGNSLFFLGGKRFLRALDTGYMVWRRLGLPALVRPLWAGPCETFGGIGPLSPRGLVLRPGFPTAYAVGFILWAAPRRSG